MEIFELKYFLEIARNENIHRASEQIRVSPSSLSKTVSRLEKELGVRLFLREGRNIRLTEHGKFLKLRALQILRIENSTKSEIAGDAGEVNIIIAGPEVLLSKFGISLYESLLAKQRIGSVEFQTCDENRALKNISQGDAHLAIVTTDIPMGLSEKILGEVRFRTVVGKQHPLYARAHAKKSFHIDEVLEHAFVSPSLPFLGQVGLKQSMDGWRDDIFPRKVKYLTSSTKLLETLVVDGRAVAYLPDYFAEKLELETLKINGCPYSCTQKVRLVAHRPEDVSWLNQIF